MKIYLILPIAVFVFLLGNCRQNSTGMDENNDSHLLNYIDYGCQNGNGFLAKPYPQCLENWYYDGCILDLRFRFTTLCEAIFEDSCAISGERLDLYLTNVQNATPLCACEYLNTFSIAWPVSGNVHITLNYRYKIHPEYHYTMIDTVITLR